MSDDTHNFPTAELGGVLSQLRNGLSVRQSKEEDGLPISRIETISDGNVNPERVGFAGIAVGEKDDWLLEEGDILFSHINSVEHLGKCAIYAGTPSQLIHGMNLLNLRADRSKILPRFLLYALREPQFRSQIPQITKKSVNQASLSITALKTRTIPLPPLSEQKRIADILDKADAIRRKRQEAIESLDAMRQAVLYDTVLNSKKRDDWREERLGDIADVKGGIALSSRRGELDRKAPYLRVANVYRDRLDLVEIKEIGLTNAEFERTKLLFGDVLIVEGHGNRDEIGRSAIWDGSIPECVHQNHLIRVRPNESIIRSVYLSAFINSSLGRRQLFRFGKTTSGLNTISLSNVRNTVILLPPLALQQRMEKVIKETTRLLTPLNAAFSHATDLFNSLVQRAFKGEL